MVSESVAEPPRRLHPITPVFDLIANARQLAVPAGLAVFGGEWWFALPIALLALGRAVRWLRFTYQIDGHVIRTSEGVFIRKKRTIALDRIQQVEVVSKLRHRLLGVVDLHVDTASGATGAELELTVVSTREAERLRRIFEARSTTPAPAPEEPVAAIPAPAVSLSAAELALAGMTGAQTLVILSLAFSLQEIGNVDLARVRTLVPEDAQSDPLTITFGVIAGATAWLGLAAVAQILTHYGFTLRVTDRDFRVTRGLFDRREVGASLGRIQAVRIEQTLIRRILGFVAIRVQTAAVPGQDVSKIVIPYVRSTDVERVVRALLPQVAPSPVLPRSPRSALALAMLRRVPLSILLSLAVAATFWPWGGFALTAVPFSVAAAWLHWSTHGFALSGTTLWARSGGLFRETVVVPTSKAQSLRFAASALQRRCGLATLRIDVAGRGRTPRLHDAASSDLETIVATISDAAATDERKARAARI